MRNVYTSRKRSRKASSTTSKEQEVEDIWVAPTEVDKEGTTIMAVVVLVAAAGSPDDGVAGIHGTLGHSEEEPLTKTKPGTERTTAVESSPTGAAGDAPIHQAQIISFPLTYLTYFTTAVLGLHICSVVADMVLIMSLPWGGHNLCALVGTVHTAEESITVRATDTSTIVHGWRMGADGRCCRRNRRGYIQNIIEDNHRISYSVPRHTMTDAVASTYVVYHNHECGVPRYAVQA
ncbi:hypothetical protein Cgig2_024297 [Carnegiea gigantea]|uniref:Uncharacterized protein n=1 Tax=Carnegiea gigantea TaxID=171969 RepID=A0A9Q1GQQ3_9CARY|nr:hypothetical protein Cgig2_024297 [Carnegiea gigantea]